MLKKKKGGSDLTKIKRPQPLKAKKGVTIQTKGGDRNWLARKEKFHALRWTRSSDQVTQGKCMGKGAQESRRGAPRPKRGESTGGQLRAHRYQPPTCASRPSAAPGNDVISGDQSRQEQGARRLGRKVTSGAERNRSKLGVRPCFVPSTRMAEPRARRGEARRVGRLWRPR
jgi:hypothetical protein